MDFMIQFLPNSYGTVYVWSFLCIDFTLSPSKYKYCFTLTIYKHRKYSTMGHL